MQAKLFVVGVFIFLVGIIAGLFFLIQKQADIPIAGEEGATDLSIASEQEESSLPQGIQLSEEGASTQQEQQQQQEELAQATSITNSPQAPSMNIDKSKSYSAVLETSEGNITIEFTTAQTPETVNNFIELARKDFYDDTIFHRVISGFMIQGGDPKGDGTGGPGYKFDDEDFDGEYSRGTVAMANSGPNTNGSQFFIMHEDNSSLPPNYVIFGQVTDGLDAVDAIAEAEVTSNRGGEQSSPVEPIMIKNVKIIED